LRRFLLSGGTTVDMNNVNKKIHNILDCFDTYLENSPFKYGSTTRHAIMGPIPKVLQRAFSGRWGVEDLAGYAYRIHEMSNKNTQIVSEEARKNLEKGIESVLELYDILPQQMIQKTKERVEYSLFYRRRKQQSLYFEQIRKDFAAFLEEKYPNIEDLQIAWEQQSIKDYNIYPSKKNKAYEDNPMRKKDIDLFWSNYRLVDEVNIEEMEEITVEEREDRS